jgi:16S rRNA (cytosine1402-N4)-methyltransferase
LGENGRLLALDLDPAAIEAAKTWGAHDPRLILRKADFRDLTELLAETGLGQVDGILVDLGVNSGQLLSSARGFSFQGDGPLDMRFDPERGQTAADILNSYGEKALADLFYRYGEERGARRLARAIVETRAKVPFSRTGELVALANKILGHKTRQRRINPATRVFLALRSEVNDEPGALARLLNAAWDNLKLGGRLVIISFHSMEDREVKNLFRKGPKDVPALWQGLWKKPHYPSEKELALNPRSRSARMRAGVKLKGSLT